MDVLIVGAGPSGLMMAAQLLRYGVVPTIIDTKSGPDRASKAIGVHARSLEFFRQMGLVDRLLAKGNPCYGVQVQGRHAKPLGKLDLSQLEDTSTAFPFILLVGQDKTEKLLIDRLTESACPVAWETRLLTLRQDDQMAFAEVEQDGVIHSWTCNWVIGADGVNSTVRKCMGIPFEGKPLKGHFFLADVHIRDVHNRQAHFFLPKTGMLAIFPLDKTGGYRIMGLLPPGAERERVISYTDVKEAVDGSFGAELPVDKCVWISTFVLQSRLAEQFVRQRCFLVGDAAHVHSPVGGQGMNTGLQDAVNLAWKLAGVVNRRIAPPLLHTYQRERKPVASAVIRDTDRVFGPAVGMPGWLKPLRDRLLAVGLRMVGRKQHWLRRAFENMAQLTVHYRRSPLAIHHAQGFRIQAGDRLPFLPVFDEKTKTQTDLHRWCEKPGFVLLVLGTISSHHLHIIGQWMRQKYPREMHLYYLPYSQANHSVFEAFEVNPDGTKIVLIRPDMYIGYINDMLNVSLIDTYMEEVIGWKLKDNE